MKQLKSFKDFVNESRKVKDQDSIPHSIHRVWESYWEKSRDMLKFNAYADAFYRLSKADQMKIVILDIFKDFDKFEESGGYLADKVELKFGVKRGSKNHKDPFNYKDKNGELLFDLKDKDPIYKKAQKQIKKDVKEAESLEKKGEINGMSDMIKSFT